jgi:hypothetical protein
MRWGKYGSRLDYRCAVMTKAEKIIRQGGIYSKTWHKCGLTLDRRCAAMTKRIKEFFGERVLTKHSVCAMLL